MFKKFMALFLLTAFTHAYAVTPVQQSFALADQLNKTFDELNYKLNVEWDQSDSKYMGAALDDFEKEISSIQKQGLSNKELVQYTLNKIKDKRTKDEINEITKVIDDNQMDSEAARPFVISKLNNTYSHGASWSGSRMGTHCAFILAVVLILICCSQHHGKQGPAGPAGPTGPTGPDGSNGENNGYGNGDQDAPGGSCTHNNAENSGCVV